MARRSEETGITPTAFIAGTLLLLLLVGTLIWFAIPGLSASHRFTSPIGAVTLEVGEQCDGTTCQRAIIAEFVAADGSKSRRACTVPLTEQRPMLLNAYPLWTPDEAAVDIVHADADGIGGKFRLVLATDCPPAG